MACNPGQTKAHGKAGFVPRTRCSAPQIRGRYDDVPSYGTVPECSASLSRALRGTKRSGHKPRVFRALHRPFVEVAGAAASAGDVRIRVDELVGRQLVDRAFLRFAGKIRIGARYDFEGHRLLLFIDGVGAEQRNATPHDGAVFLRRAGETVVAGELRQIACRVDLRKLTASGEDQDSGWRLAERKRFLAVGRDDLGD